MKRTFLGFAAITGLLFASSCSEEIPNNIADGSEVNVSFSIGVENTLSTRAISDSKKSDRLVYQLFDAEGTPVTEEPVVLDNVTFPYDEISLRLIKGQTYQIAFWAQNSNCDAYNVDDLRAVTVNYTGVNNDETRDAFFKTEVFTVTSDMKVSSTLYRPFAQINVGVVDEDWEKAASMQLTKSEVLLSNAANEINLLTGKVSGEATVNYTADLMPVAWENDSQKLTVKNIEGEKEYNYLSMCYILAPDLTTDNGAAKTTLETLEFNFSNNNGSKTINLRDGLTNVPVQRNWRTNILGSFLTTDISFEISLEPDYIDDYNYPEYSTIADGISYDKSTKTLYISNAAGLQWFMNATNSPSKITVNENSPMSAAQMKAIAGTNGAFAGQTVKLVADIDMKGIKFTPIQYKSASNGLECTFDGGNHQISNLTFSTKEQGQQVGFIAKLNGTVKNLRIDNANFTGINYIGGVVGGVYGNVINCHVTNSTLTANVHTDNGEGADIGGIVGFLRDTSGNIEDCSVTNVTIKGSRDIGGVVGKYQGYTDQNHITGCVLNNVDIFVSVPANYAEYDKVFNRGTRGQAETYGPIAGYVMINRVPTTNLDGSSNQDNNYLHNVNINVFDGSKPNDNVTTRSITALNEALKAGCKNITLSPGEYTFGSPLYDGGNQRFNNMNEEVTLNMYGVTVTGPFSPNFRGATVNGLTAVSPSADKRCIMGAFVGTFNDCTFIGGMYTESKASPSTFNNCKFICDDVTTPGLMAFHIGLLDAGNTVTLNDCTIDGRCDFGVSGNLVFKNCTLNVKANWELYGSGTYTFDNCKINYSNGAQIKNMGSANIVGL